MKNISANLFVLFEIAILAFCIPEAYSKPSIEDFGALPSVSMMAVSPSGNLVAFRQSGKDHDVVVVYSLLGNKILTGISIKEITPRWLYFINDVQVILVASKYRRVSGFRGKFDLSTALLMDSATGETRQLLTPGDVIYRGQAGLGRVVGLSPDRAYVYMPAFVPDSKSDQSPDYSLLKVSLNTRRSLNVVREGSSNTIDYFIDSKGEVIAEERYNQRTNLHQILARKDEEWIEIFRDKKEIPEISVVGVTENMKSLVVLDEAETSGRSAYFTMSLEDGAVSGPIFGRDDADIEAVLTDINRVVYGVRYSGFTPTYEFFDKKIEDSVNRVIGKFSQHSVWLTDWTPNWKTMLFHVEGPNFSGDYFIMSGDKLQSLARSRDRISKEHINPIAVFNYKARDGLTIPALLTFPLHIKSLKNLPTVMLPHGGPESYDRLGFDWLAQAFASRGYLVIQPQFRGSSGFGLQHKEAGYGEWGKKMLDDLTDGVNVLIKEKLTDPRRVCIVGASYGGYAALAAGAFEPDTYQCVASINGIADLPLMIKQEKSDHGKYHWVLTYWKKAMVDGDVMPEKMESVSPARFAQNFKTPVLLVHSTNDSIVSIDQSKHMNKRLLKAKKQVVFKKLKNNDHYLSERETRIEALKIVLDFVGEHIGKTHINKH